MQLLSIVTKFLRHWISARTAEAQLARLSDDELKDIGILRSEIHDVARGRIILH